MKELEVKPILTYQIPERKKEEKLRSWGSV